MWARTLDGCPHQKLGLTSFTSQPFQKKHHHHHLKLLKSLKVIEDCWLFLETYKDMIRALGFMENFEGNILTKSYAISQIQFIHLFHIVYLLQRGSL